MSPYRIILVAGGTGGHIYPALSLAKTLTCRGHDILILTDLRGKKFDMESRMWEVRYIPATNPSRPGFFSKWRAIVQLIWGFVSARKVLKNFNPDVAIGFGGYPSLAPILAAFFEKIPVVLHEQNAVFGRANRLLARKAVAIAKSFDRTMGVELDNSRLVTTGNPVREEIIRVRNTPIPEIKLTEPIYVLGVGGSLGARILSEVVPPAMASLPKQLRDRIIVNQQCRLEDIERVRSIYDENDLSAEIKTFFDNIPSLLKNSHIVISRSGASTIAELAIVGRPSILIPYRFALDNHQYENAMALSLAGAAWCIEESALTEAELAKRLKLILKDNYSYAEAAGAAHKFGIPDAAERLADLVEEVSSEHPRHILSSHEAISENDEATLFQRKAVC